MAGRKKLDAGSPGMDDAVRPHVEERGEIALVLEGESLIMRPSYEAISAFEVSTGKGLLVLARSALDGTLAFSEAAQIATECIKAWGRATGSKSAQGVNAPRVAELIMESEGGFRSALQSIAAMLALAVTGGYTAQGELKATATMTTTA